MILFPLQIKVIEVVSAASTSAPNCEAKRSSLGATNRGRQLIKNLVRQRPRRTFTKKQMEEHNLGIILIAMSSLFIFCQSFKIIPDMYELILCNRLGHFGSDCEMRGSVSAFHYLQPLSKFLHKSTPITLEKFSEVVTCYLRVCIWFPNPLFKGRHNKSVA